VQDAEDFDGEDTRKGFSHLPHDYDYDKHLKPMGGGRFIPAPNVDQIPLRALPPKPENKIEFDQWKDENKKEKKDEKTQEKIIPKKKKRC